MTRPLLLCLFLLALPGAAGAQIYGQLSVDDLASDIEHAQAICEAHLLKPEPGWSGHYEDGWEVCNKIPSKKIAQEARDLDFVKKVVGEK